MNDQTKKTTHSNSSTRSQVTSSTGNFETQARNLAMRQLRCSDPKKLDFFEAGQKVSKIEESTIKF